MTVAAILAKKGAAIHTVDPGATVGDAARLLASNRIGALPVVDASGALKGIVSERDIVRVVAAEGGAALDKPVSTAATANVVCATRADTVADLMQKMTAGRFRHVPVLEEGRLVGMVSIGDVVKRRIDEQELEVESLKGYVAGFA
jgi:CBS domain-containing protein